MNDQYKNDLPPCEFNHPQNPQNDRVAYMAPWALANVARAIGKKESELEVMGNRVIAAPEITDSYIHFPAADGKCSRCNI